MFKIYKFIFKDFMYSFSYMSFILFFIGSLIFFLRASDITFIAKVGTLDILKLFSYLLPEMFLYVLSITFFISLILSTYKMSKENELMSIFTMGVASKKIRNFYLILASLFSVALLAISIFIVPISTQLYEDFKNNIEYNKRFNTSSLELQKSISGWYISIDKKEDNNDDESRVVVFNPNIDKNTVNITIANEIQTGSKKNYVEFILKNGATFYIKENSIDKSIFKNMNILYDRGQDKTLYHKPLAYWSNEVNNTKNMAKYALYIALSLFPLVSCLYGLSIGITNVRYEKNIVYSGMFLTPIVFFCISYFIGQYLYLYGIIGISILFFILSIFICKKRITSKY